MSTTCPEEAERLRSILAEKIVVDDIAGEHDHTDLRSTADQPVTSHYYRPDCPACGYVVRATAELDGSEPLSVGVVGRCCDLLGTTVGQLLIEAGRPDWADSVDIDDVGTPAQFVQYTAELGRLSGAFGDDLIRDCDLVVTGVQFSTRQGDVEAGVPVLELNAVRPGVRASCGALSLSLSDAHRLALALLRASWAIEPPANPEFAELIAHALSEAGR